MAASDFQSWYDPDNWNAETSPADALPAFAAAALRANVDIDAAMEGLTFTREYNSTENYYYMRVVGTSMVFAVDTLFRMPKYFNEIVTVTELNGFIYSPIAPETVVE